MYIDEIYKGSGVGQAGQIFDVDRVEILKGPQGTLYGRNTTGGLFHIITRKPTDEFDLRASASYGSYDKVVVEGAIGGPIADGIRTRVAGKYINSDGWIDGFLDGVEYSDVDSGAVRGMLEFDIGQDGILLLIGNYAKVDQNGVGFGLNGYLDPITGARCSLGRIEAGECVSPTIDAAGVGLSANQLGGLKPGVTPGSNLTFDRGQPPQQKVESYGISAQLDWDFDSWQLKAIVAYDNIDKFYEEDLDAANFFFDEGFSLQGEEWKVDVRASGTYNEANWLLGVFYFNDEKDLGSFVIPDILFNSTGIQDTTSTAIYGQLEMPISEKLELVLGGRYTEEDRGLDYTRNSLFGPAIPSFTATRGLQSEVFTGKFGINWYFNKDTLFYGTVSTGFKSGGFNTQLVFGPPAALDPVEDEKITAYELGIKTEFLQGKARINAATFYYDYRDLQLGIFSIVPGAPFGASVLKNAGDAKVYGFEVESFFLIMENLEINLAIGLLDTEVESSAVIQSSGRTTSIDGHELPRSPGVSFSALGRYYIPLDSLGTLGFQVNYSWRDNQFFSIENFETESHDSYGLLNLRVDWKSIDKHYSAAFFVDNVFDKEHSTFTSDLDSTFGIVTWQNPRWFGVKIGYQY